MSARAWLGEGARAALADAVRRIEARSSAEVVVTLRGRSDDHRHVDLAFGSVAALGALLVYVFWPATFRDDLAVIAIVATWIGGVVLGGALDLPKRLFVGRARRRAVVARAARAAFVEQGVSATSDRRGILVYVSLLEREAAIVADVGVDPGPLAAEWNAAVTAVESAMRAPSTLTAMTKALDGLGDLLARLLPSEEGAVNELSDEVVE